VDKKSIVIIILAAALVVVTLLFWLEGKNSNISSMKMNTENKNQENGKKILYWRAPMDPNEIYDHPGKSKMGMDLVPVYEDEGGGKGIIKIDPAVEQNMNLKTEVVQKKILSSRVITNGVLITDEQNEYIVTTRVNGWVDKLYVNYTGQVVKRGEKLMDIYSPELVAAEQELLTALSYKSTVNNSTLDNVSASGDELLKNAERKMELLEIPLAEIQRLKETKEIKTDMTLYAQKSGTVLDKNVIEGQKIMAGASLLHIADLSRLWLTADIYEYELNKIDLGAKARIKFNYFPGKIYEGKISFIYPTIDPKSRTAKVRIDINNPTGNLKPEMFANVEIEGRNLGDYPVVPENAVIRSGTDNIVIIALGGGKFKPKQVELGNYSDGYYQVLKGLDAGTTIVTSAQFLIDSESNLRAAVGQMQNAENQDTTQKNNMKNMKMEYPEKKEQNVSSSLIRKEPIDVKAIDKNKDGKVYEDIMDWNVISDSPGVCPICGMTLREFTVNKAEQNLKEHGFKVK
jgi:Cu(I)/Ag(I) efflux system membrane fusion protein